MKGSLQGAPAILRRPGFKVKSDSAFPSLSFSARREREVLKLLTLVEDGSFPEAPP